jgi:hypothetical protein
MLSDHKDFRAFCAERGLPLHLCNRPQASGIAEKKRSIIEKQTQEIRDVILAEPFREREQRKLKVLKELSDGGRALRAAVMNRLIPDLEVTQRKEGETQEQWAARIHAKETQAKMLTPGELMALSAASKVADELVRKAEGLEDFDWEDAERNQKVLDKAGALRFEVVKTSGAKPLDQLEHAPEDRAKGAG